MTEITADTLVEVAGLFAKGPRGLALEDVSFAMPSGTVTALVAEPKPLGLLLLDCIAGVHPPAQGTVHIRGADPYQDDQARQRVSIVRGPGRFPWAVRVDELVRHVSTVMDDSGGAERVMAELDIGNLAKRYAAELPGEQQIMVRVACSLLGDPDVLLYDRLMQNLSPGRAAVVARMLDRARQQGQAVMVAGDDIERIQGSCDRIAVLAGGRLRTCETVENVLKSGPNCMRVEVFTASEVEPGLLQALACVQEVRPGEGKCDVLVDNRFAAVRELLGVLEQHGIELGDVRTYRPSLPEAIMEMLREG